MKTPEDLYNELLQNGGFTYQPVTGEVPDKGYMVSILPEYSVVRNMWGVCPKTIENYIKQHSHIWTIRDYFVGAWMDGTTLYLDVSKRVDTMMFAENACKQFNQLAYYDLEHKCEVRI